MSVICRQSWNLQTADECQEGALDVKAGGIKSGSETLCFSLDVLYWCSAAVHLCPFGSARTDDLKARNRQEGSGLASSGGSHTWHVMGGVKTAKIKIKAPSSSTKSDLTQQLRTGDHRLTFNELTAFRPMRWAYVNHHCKGFSVMLFCVSRSFVVPHALKTWSRWISRPERSCCNLHLHWGGCVRSLHHSFNTLLQSTWAHSVITELPTSHPFVLTDLQ